MRNLAFRGLRLPRLGAMSGGFSPASLFAGGIAGPALIPEREFTFTRTIGGVFEPVTTTGDAVARLTSMVNGISAEQLTVAKRPSYNEGTGLSWLAFDGVDDAMATAAIDFTGTDKMSVFAGVRKLSDVGVKLFYELSANSNSNNGVFLSAPGYLGTGSIVGPYWNVSAKGTIPQGATTPATFPAPQTVVQTHLMDIAGDRVTLRINGTQEAQKTEDLGTGNFGNYALNIGARNQTSIFFNGLFYGLIVPGKLVSAAEIASTEAYMAAKTGVVL